MVKNRKKKQENGNRRQVEEYRLLNLGDKLSEAIQELSPRHYIISLIVFGKFPKTRHSRIESINRPKKPKYSPGIDW